MFVIGAPIACFLIIFFGLKSIVGPIPAPSAVQRIKDGEIKVGDPMSDVLKRLGKPKSVTTHDDGSMMIVYTRTVSDGELQIEEGVISADSTGHVLESHVDRVPTAKPTTTG